MRSSKSWRKGRREVCSHGRNKGVRFLEKRGVLRESIERVVAWLQCRDEKLARQRMRLMWTAADATSQGGANDVWAHIERVDRRRHRLGLMRDEIEGLL
jgi:hypothetical protein